MIVWITGAGGGIGKEIAMKFAKNGATVAISSRSADKLSGIKDELEKEGLRAITIPCDVTSPEAVQFAVSEIVKTAGPIDVLINNAGVTIFRAFSESTIEDFDAILNTNLRGPFLCAKAVLPSMLERRKGAIIMVNSLASREVFPNSSVYSASKAGLKALTDCLRKEVRNAGIRVISIYPGATDTDIWSPKVREKHKHKMMFPEDIAEILYSVLQLPERSLVEDIYLQPIGGPL